MNMFFVLIFTLDYKYKMPETSQSPAFAVLVSYFLMTLMTSVLPAPVTFTK